jgi:putative glycosyltransferase (TIGR04372 family)
MASAPGFFARQILHIREGGASALLRKMRILGRMGITLLVSPVSLVVCLAARALRPLVLVRFGPLVSDRIGHYAANTEIYLCERDANPPSRPVLDLFYDRPPIANRQLQRMWRRVIHLSPIYRWVDSVNRLLPGAETHRVDVYASEGWDRDQLLRGSRPHLSFTDREKARGEGALRVLGVGEAGRYVCFHARDSAYLSRLHPTTDWAYHDYRDCDIKTYVPAMRGLAREGLFSVRMGAVVKEALDTDDPKIIDYATSGARSEFLDIYLPANAEFFVVSDAGIFAVSAIFRRPVVFTNFIPFGPVHTWSEDYLTIPKKLWLPAEHRFLTFPEIMGSPISWYDTTDDYRRAGLEVVDDTPEEIAAVVSEMSQRVAGTWTTTDEDEELQQRFWRLLTYRPPKKAPLSRIGADFLRENRELLG